MKLSDYFGNRSFYRSVLAVSLPIMIQNGITNFVNLLDNIMLGQLGTEQMSGAAVVNQLIFVLNLCLFGLVSGAGIFTTQFDGKKDVDGVRQTFRFKLCTSVALTVIAVALLFLFREPLIELYLNDGSAEGDLALTLRYGIDYMDIVLLGLIPYAISLVYSSTLSETGYTVPPMTAGFAAVGVNCISNYILIFGKLGAPALGVRGAAIATVISRFVELAILIFYTHLRQEKHEFIRNAYRRLFGVSRALALAIFKRGTPLFINEGLWAAGISAMAWCYSMRGLSAVAGYNIAHTILNVFAISYMALGKSVGIIVGKYLGAGEYDTAVTVDRKLMTFSVLASVLMGGALFLTAEFFPQIYNTTDEVREIACGLLRIAAIIMPLQSYVHGCYFTLRAGGKTGITFLFDSVFVCCVNFPVTFLLSYFTPLPILPLYAITNGLEIFKCTVGFILLKKRVWINRFV